MIEILFKLKSDENFRKLELNEHSFSHCTDTEELSIELKEYIYNEVAGENGKYETFEEFEDDFDNFIFQNGDYWVNVVEPLFNTLKSDYNEDYESDGDEGWEREDLW